MIVDYFSLMLEGSKEKVAAMTNKTHKKIEFLAPLGHS